MRRPQTQYHRAYYQKNKEKINRRRLNQYYEQMYGRTEEQVKSIKHSLKDRSGGIRQVQNLVGGDTTDIRNWIQAV